jgi:peptidoglycan/LPS O-acetylase OafA/YrhL
MTSEAPPALVPAQRGARHRAEGPGGEGVRLGFLDVLRGLAALSVVAFHLVNQQPVYTNGFWTFSHAILNLGSFGVLLFFVVSGFIIPASLERTGSVMQFWISRVFRLVPVFWLVSAGVVVLQALGQLQLPDYVLRHPVVTFVGNVTLLSHFVGSPVLIGSGWTLPFEICFYLLTTVLFVTRLGTRARSVGIALLGAAIALLAYDWIYPGWGLTPQASGDHSFHGTPVRVVLTGIVVATVAALLSRVRPQAAYAAVVGGSAAMLLLNRPWPLHEAAIYVTLMFTGTVIYRVASGQIAARLGWSVVAVVAGACTLAFWLHTPPSTLSPLATHVQVETWWTRSVAMLAALGLFVAFFSLRDRVRWPEFLQWLGRISYSVYLVHWVVMESVPPLPAGTPARAPLSLIMWLAITLGVSSLTYYLVEKPAINAGRRVGRWVRTRRTAALEASPQPAGVPSGA